MTTMTQVRERPILFSSDEEVRSILDERKTQTRRVVTRQNSYLGVAVQWEWLDFDEAMPDRLWGGLPGLKVPTSKASPEYSSECVVRLYPRYEVGDRLWVREAFSRCACAMCRAVWPHQPPPDQLGHIHYPAYRATHLGPSGLVWRPSIHMPQWASRIMREITDVRAERVQEITDADASAEGFASRWAFWSAWDAIYAARGYGMERNPWVWAITFRRVKD